MPKIVELLVGHKSAATYIAKQIAEELYRHNVEKGKPINPGVHSKLPQIAGQLKNAGQVRVPAKGFNLPPGVKAGAKVDVPRTSVARHYNQLAKGKKKTQAAAPVTPPSAPPGRPVRAKGPSIPPLRPVFIPGPPKKKK